MPRRRALALCFILTLLTPAARAFEYVPDRPTPTPVPFAEMFIRVPEAEAPASFAPAPKQNQAGGAVFPLSAERDEMHKLVLSLQKKYRVLGGAVLASLNGQEVYREYLGTLDKRGRHPVDARSLFRSASVTKMVTAMGVMKLVEEGKIDLDGDISALMGFSIRNPHHPDAPITPRQILCHTSSLASTGSFNRRAKTLKQLLAGPGREKYFLKQKPGSFYTYSNLNGGLMGAMIEQASGMSVNDYMQANFFAPLGIEAAYSLRLLSGIDETRISPVYQKDGATLESVKRLIQNAEGYENTSDGNLHYNITIGALWISPEGLLKLTEVLANGGECRGVRVLQEDTVRMMLTDPSLAPQSTVSLAGGEYGLGVQRQKMGTKTWWGHQGTVHGMLINACFEPESRLCFIAMANSMRIVKQNRVGVTAIRICEEAEKLWPAF